ncbi:MAG TPA: DUF6655 family protein [Caulobacteraceae bacterium]|jgi:hypothetical protein|nr:DUF6655 family protein [Caulobacteraceae bacterium]
MSFRAAVAALATACLCACTSLRASEPPRTATEERLASTAIDRAAERLAEQMPSNLKIFLDTSALDGPDAHYAAAAVTDSLLRRGLRMAASKTEADAVVEVRSGVMSSDEKTTLIGAPPLAVPFFPVGNLLSLPEIDFYKRSHAKGVAEFAATGFDPKSGKMVVSTDPQFGFSSKTSWVVFLLFSWEKDDLVHEKGLKGNGSGS